MKQHNRSKNAVLLMIIFICSICLNNVWARETGTMDQLEKENPDDVDKMNKVLYYYNTLFFENYTEEGNYEKIHGQEYYTEEELKQQEKFQKSIHLLNELYFEYGSLENIPILPFDPENIREGDSLFTEVVAVINTENNETYFVTENDDMKLLKKCLEKLQYYNGNSVTKSNEELTEAIKNFQKEEGLTIDGIAGNEVWRKIDILMLNKVIEDD